MKQRHHSKGQRDFKLINLLIIKRIFFSIKSLGLIIDRVLTCAFSHWKQTRYCGVFCSAITLEFTRLGFKAFWCFYHPLNKRQTRFCSRHRKITCCLLPRAPSLYSQPIGSRPVNLSQCTGHNRFWSNQSFQFPSMRWRRVIYKCYVWFNE